MASSCIRLVLALLLCVNSLVYASICSKFQLGGPCLLLPGYTTTTTTTLSPLLLGNSYCELTCSQGNDALFSSLCQCAAATTTTTTEEPTTTTTATTTTTPAPETCYYTRNRPAQLGTIVKRMYSGTDVATECEYPGVVGLYNASQVFQCMGTLLEENVILIDSICYSTVSSTKVGTVYAHVGSYQQPDVPTDLPSLVISSAAYLDTTGVNTKLYTVNLSSPFTFNESCVQPACVPNTNLNLADIDDTDCRIVGYGNTADTSPSSSPTLKEVKVTLNLNTINGPIKYTRQDGLGAKTGPCTNDQGAPLICRHKVTEEWITIGITVTVGVPCTTGKIVAPTAASLVNTAFKTALQSFKYVPA